jgi:thiol-disulfide isomerase/thioredoxin
MYRILMILLLTVSVTWAAPGDVTTSMPQSGQAIVGQDAPFLSGWTISSKVFSTAKALKDPDSERIALVFWATWCQPCLNGLKVLNAASAKLKANGIDLVLVNYGEDQETIQAFLKKHPVRFPVVMDRWDKSGAAYLYDETGKVTLPRTVLIDKEGRVEAIFSSEGDDYVERILAGE